MNWYKALSLKKSIKLVLDFRFCILDFSGNKLLDSYCSPPLPPSPATLRRNQLHQAQVHVAVINSIAHTRSSEFCARRNGSRKVPSSSSEFEFIIFRNRFLKSICSIPSWVINPKLTQEHVFTDSRSQEWVLDQACRTKGKLYTFVKLSGQYRNFCKVVYYSIILPIRKLKW